MSLLPWLVALRGLFAITFGALALAQPGHTLLPFSAIFGTYALLSGVVFTVVVLRAQAMAPFRTPALVGGLAGLAVAVASLVSPGVDPFLIGLWAVLTGGAEIAAGLWLRPLVREQVLVGLVGVTSVVVGLLVLVMYEANAGAIGGMLGGWALAAGGVFVLAAWRLHRPRLRMRARPPALTRRLGA